MTELKSVCINCNSNACAIIVQKGTNKVIFNMNKCSNCFRKSAASIGVSPVALIHALVQENVSDELIDEQ